MYIYDEYIYALSPYAPAPRSSLLLLVVVVRLFVPITNVSAGSVRDDLPVLALSSFFPLLHICSPYGGKRIPATFRSVVKYPFRKSSVV